MSSEFRGKLPVLSIKFVVGRIYHASQPRPSGQLAHFWLSLVRLALKFRGKETVCDDGSLKYEFGCVQYAAVRLEPLFTVSSTDVPHIIACSQSVKSVSKTVLRHAHFNMRGNLGLRSSASTFDLIL